MRYKKFIEDKATTIELAPLMHTCDGINFRSIIDRSEIQPSLCPVFNDNLAYYFYGRPAYRLKDNNCSSLIELFPVCFIIDPDYLTSLKRIFPFDTGAFNAELFNSHISSNLDMHHFELHPTFDFLKKFVSYVYGNNANYYKGKTKLHTESLSPLYTEFNSLIQMINYRGKEKIDDRCSTIEIQSEQSINIRSGAIKAIVMPSEMLDDECVIELLLDNDIDPITYEVYRSSPSSMTSVILNKTAEYLSNEGVI